MESFFSQSQLSVAFAIAKSIPQDQSVQEFVTHLLQAIRTDSRDAQSRPHRYVESGEFWKGQYNAGLEENKKLRSKILAEQERHRIFRRTVSEAAAAVDDGSSVSRKRPLGMEEVEDWISDAETPDPIDMLRDDYLLLSSYTIRIGRDRRDLENVTKDSDAPEHLDTLLAAACKFIGLLDEALSQSLAPLWQLSCNESQNVILLQQMMHQVTIGYLATFEALNEVAKTIPGRKKRSTLSNRLVTFFRTALDHLHTVSKLQAGFENEQKANLRSKRAKVEAGEYAVNKYLSRSLVQICQIDWKTGMLGHGEILEGILCSVLDHTGHLLSHVVFKEHVAASDKPGNISVEPAASPTVATTFEFRYLVPILHAALGGNARKELVAKVLAENQQRAGRATVLGGQTLRIAKKRIQEQLVKSALGSSTIGLALPAPPEDAEAYPAAETEKDESEWFLEAVWALVGWESAVEGRNGESVSSQGA